MDAPDRRLISLSDEDSVRYWTQVLGVTREELWQAVRRVGHQAWAVRKWLHER
jgi:hypothetical protein